MCVKFFLFLLIPLILLGCSTMPTIDRPSWHDNVMKVTGVGFGPETGNPGQKQLMAKRAAEISALATLAVQVKSLPVDTKTKVADYLPQDWGPNGFSIESVQCDESSGACYTTISMPLSPVWEIVEQKKR